jgi:hypothetical protein
MTNEERFEVFGEFDPSKYEEEAKQRWGDTPAYKESKRRTARYGKKEWQQIKDEGAALNQAVAKLMDERAPATDARAVALAEKHREYISKWFYSCSHEIHRGLGEMYVADARFTQSFDRFKPGLAAYLSAAIAANARGKT